MDLLVCSIIIGAGATATTDAWGVMRQKMLGIPAANYGLVGRWLAGFAQGKFRHDSIAQSPAVAGERVLGWTAHYLIGIAFAAILLGICGLEWIGQPTLAPALIFGVVTVAAPFFFMQPGMGAGIAASRTPKPASARIQSLLNHAIFGLGLYGSAFVARTLCA